MSPRLVSVSSARGVSAPSSLRAGGPAGCSKNEGARGESSGVLAPRGDSAERVK